MAGKPDDPFSELRKRGFQIVFHSHAQAILGVDFPLVLQELASALEAFKIPVEEIIGSGGGESKGTQRLRRALTARGWRKTKFEIQKVINGVPRESISHEIDHVRSFDSPPGEPARCVALEIEWNNKDPFFDRDLENFKRLHAEGAISAGSIVTRGTSLHAEMRSLVGTWADENRIDGFEKLQELGVVLTPRQRAAIDKRSSGGRVSFRRAWVEHFVSDKFGAATTHWAKLEDRVKRGVGNPCPLLLVGLPSSIVVFGSTIQRKGFGEESGDFELEP